MTAHKATPLRAVAPGEQPTRSQRSVVDAAKSGSQRELLVAMRDRIAAAVAKADCPPRDLAALTKRLQDIARDIAMIDAQAEDESQLSAGVVDDRFDSSAV